MRSRDKKSSRAESSRAESVRAESVRASSTKAGAQDVGAVASPPASSAEFSPQVPLLSPRVVSVIPQVSDPEGLSGERSTATPPDAEAAPDLPTAPSPALLHSAKVPRDAAGLRLDRYLAQWLEPEGLTRSRLQALIEEEQVRVNGALAKASLKLKGGELLEVVVPPPRPSELIPEDIPLEILYQDSALMVINKPANMVVHPAKGALDGTLVHALLYAVEDLSGIGGEERPGIVHRLDKDTSGVLVVAKSDLAHRGLSEQFKAHSITRRYRALVRGAPPETGTWRSELGRSPHNRLKMASVASGGRHAVTHFRVLERYPGASLMEFTLETGRTHQIRVHTSEAGFPILCDEIYGGHSTRGLPDNAVLRVALQAANRQLLHARQLGFVHPETGQYLEFITEPPEDFQRVLEALRALSGGHATTSAEFFPEPEPVSPVKKGAWDPLTS